MFKLLIATTALMASMSLAIKDTDAKEMHAYNDTIRKTRVLSSNEMLFPEKREDVVGQSRAQELGVFSEWRGIIQKKQTTRK